MEINVKSINKKDIKKEIKKCSKNIQEYIKALEKSLEIQKDLTSIAIKKLKKL